RNAWLVVEVSDDGAGLDRDAIRAAARRHGLPAQTEGEIVEAVFADGLSTRTEVTDLSGRGVGMGALRDLCLQAGGRVDVVNERGAGMALRFAFPPCATESALAA